MAVGSLFIDTNLLILLVVGSTQIELIAKNKRTNTFTSADYKLLVSLLDCASSIIVTPAVLAETSNLVSQYGDPDKTRMLLKLKEIISSVVEIYNSSKACSEGDHFVRLGLTDSGILETIPSTADFITDDLNLYLAALGKGIKAINFNHLRLPALLS